MPFKRLSIFHIDGRGYASRACALLCALFIFAALTSSAPAQEKVLGAAILKNERQELALGRFTVIQQDANDKISPQSIIASNGSILSGTLSKDDMIYLGQQGVPVWLSTKIKNESGEREWTINLGKRLEGRIGAFEHVAVYEMKVTHVTVDGVTRNNIELVEIPSRTDNGTYRINLEYNEQKIILFNIHPAAGRPVNLPIHIYSNSAYVNHIEQQASLNAAYATILTILSLTFLWMYLRYRSLVPVVACGYFAFNLIRWYMYDGLGSSIKTGFFNEIVLALLLIHSILSIYMTKIFCRIDSSNLTEKYVLHGLIFLNVVATILLYLLPTSGGAIHVAILYGAPIITMSIICIMAFVLARTGQVPSLLYFYACLLPLFGFIVTILGVCNFIPASSIVTGAFWYSIIPQGLVLLAAVNERLNMGGSHETTMQPAVIGETLNLSRIKETRDTGDHTRLLKVIEQERQLLAEFRAKETYRTAEMRRAKEEADEANRAKSAFLAVVSHEIRTPMTGVMGMVRLLLESNITKQQRDYALTIQESSEAMLALLNDILDFEKIQRGKIDLENISFDLHRLIQGVITLMSGHAAQKKITLSARVDEDIPKYVKGDPTRIRQVLLNLMGNAIKFTETGSVTLFVKNLNGQDDPNGKSSKYSIYFAVQDSGIGITQEAQKNLFNPFAQADQSIARKFGGTGLGLAISKGLIEKMGSVININSKSGEGSTFFFTLEMERGLSASPDKAKGSAESAAPGKPLQILVVDDNEITRKVVISALDQNFHKITPCASAEDALWRIEQNKYDLVLMDIELQGMSGNKAVRILRESGDPYRASLPVIAMTGNVSKEDIERYLADGMSGSLPKPIDLDKLRGIVNEISRGTFVREIRALGDAPAPQPVKPEIIEQQEAEHTADPNVFNPGMLQSLKDTIGAPQLNELLDDLIVKTDEILNAMDGAVKLGDLTALAARAHELKGMTGNFGLVEISALAAQAERKAKDEDKGALSDIVRALPEASERARSALKYWSSH